jgi:hypothetical protein
VTHEATRLAEEGPLKQQTLPGALKNILRIDADLSKPRLVPYERMLIEHAIDALAAPAQTAPTAEVALPAVSEEVTGWVVKMLTEASAIITELVACKDLKDRLDGWEASGTDEMCEMAEEYARRKSLAWERARAFAKEVDQ